MVFFGDAMEGAGSFEQEQDHPDSRCYFIFHVKIINIVSFCVWVFLTQDWLYSSICVMGFRLTTEFTLLKGQNWQLQRFCSPLSIKALGPKAISKFNPCNIYDMWMGIFTPVANLSEILRQWPARKRCKQLKWFTITLGRFQLPAL